jgi:poly [ADP-ribose] polymerase
LCDVALGNQSKKLDADYYITKEKLLKEKCHSTWGMGKNTPMSSVKLDKDITVPNGKLGNSGSTGPLLYDEYIVYDTNQISLRYLVIVKKC